MRVITRLDETCREVRDAARVIGDAELFKKMEEAQIKIKRDSTFVFHVFKTSPLTGALFIQLYSQQVCISRYPCILSCLHNRVLFPLFL